MDLPCRFLFFKVLTGRLSREDLGFEQGKEVGRILGEDVEDVAVFC